MRTISTRTSATAKLFQANGRKLCTASSSLHPHHPPPPLTSRLQGRASLQDLQSTFAAAIKTNVHQDSFFSNQFVAACSRLRRMDYALHLFAEMSRPNVFVYNAVIRGFVLCSLPLEALRFYVDEMCAACEDPTSYTFSSLVKACGLAGMEEFGEAVHGKVWKVGFGSQVFVLTALVDFYADMGRVDEARRVFDGMTERDAFSWATMISACARFGDMGSARNLFEEMPEKGAVAWNSMIAGYGRAGNVECAAAFFAEMPVKDLVSWTSMISSYSQNKRFKEAVETFMHMRDLGIVPDEVTMATVISACAHLGALHVGEDLHLYVIQNGLSLDVYIGSALIEMYAKCGDLARSLMVFFKLNRRNLFCWNSVIEGLTVHGRGRDALSIFYLMEREGEIKPNWVTFISILSACTHCGFVKEGRRIFSSMTKDYAVTPEIKHYGCLVDLLGRAGLLHEALHLIKNMKIEPNSVVWGALLSGCKIHNDLEIGQIAIERLMELEPDDSGHQALSVNMYAEANQWSDVARVRGMMKKRGVLKSSPGSSWIEMDGEVHEFRACDSSHPISNDVYLLMEELYGQLKLAACRSDLDLNSYNLLLLSDFSAIA